MAVAVVGLPISNAKFVINMVMKLHIATIAMMKIMFLHSQWSMLSTNAQSTTTSTQQIPAQQVSTQVPTQVSSALQYMPVMAPFPYFYPQMQPYVEAPIPPKPTLRYCWFSTFKFSSSRYPDSGASHHVTNVSQNIQQLTHFEVPDQITIGNGHGFNINYTFRDLLAKTKMDEASPIASPMVGGCKLSKFGSERFSDPTLYRSVVGALKYATITRSANLCQILLNSTGLLLREFSDT